MMASTPTNASRLGVEMQDGYADRMLKGEKPALLPLQAP
jgi:hypothetical protein